MPGKKILWISFTVFDLTLHKTSILEILKHLAERGNDVYWFALRSKKSMQTFDYAGARFHLILIPLRYVPMITTSLFAAATLIFLPFFIAIKKPDFIIMHPGPLIISSIWKPLLNALRIKAVLDVRSTPVLSEFRDRGLLGSLDIIWFNISVVVAKKMFDGITILSTLMKRQICSTFHIHPKFIGVWTSGGSVTLFKPENYDDLQMRKKLGLTNKFIVFYHGDLTVHRGIVESIRAIEILSSKYGDCVLFILGKGPALPVLRKLILTNTIKHRVLIHDAVEYIDVPKYIAMCDVGIVPLPDLPEWRYQCPLKLLEYLAMKKVVIVTDIPANREVIGNSKCGIYVPSSDPKEIAKAIIYAHNNRERLKEWGSYGRAIISEKYTWVKIARDLENYLLSIDKRVGLGA